MLPEHMAWRDRMSDALGGHPDGEPEAALTVTCAIGPDPVAAVAVLAALLHRCTGDPEQVIALRRAGLSELVLAVPVDAAAPVEELATKVRELVAAGAGSDVVPQACVTDAPASGPLAPGADLVLCTTDGTLTAGGFLAGTELRTAATWLGRLAEAAEAVPATPVGALPLLDETERRARLAAASCAGQPEVTPDGVSDVARAPYFHEAVAAAARRDPESLAVADPRLRLTYGELDALAGRLAGRLAGAGVVAGDRVALLLPRSARHLLAQLAVLKLGATVVLLDPSQPAERLSRLIADSAPAAVVTAGGAAPHHCVEVSLEDDTWQQAEPYTGEAAITDDSICHLVFTSGSTGTPKAVAQRHGALRALVRTLAEQTGIDASARGTWLSPPGVGLLVVDCFPLLAAGATVLIPDPDVAGHPETLRDWLLTEKVTHTLVLTAFAERLWPLSWPADGALRSMRLAGERLSSWPPDELPYEVLNVYGSSEATVVATGNLTRTARSLTPAERARRLPPIGTPAPGVHAYVLDAGHGPVPYGVPGELFVSGVSLAAGYPDDPAAHAERYLPNTVPGDPDPLLYRTGDTARQWPDGTLEIVGRADHEVKIRGFRVHPGEVESALAALPEVGSAVVTAREDIPGERRLVAYIEPVPGAAPRGCELRALLADRLPQYMVPSAWVVLDELPLSRNGKVDRAALPAPGRERPDISAEFTAPRDETERALAALWRDVLGLDEVGVLDDFFELGGDSLAAIRLVTRVSQETGVPFALSHLAAATHVRAAAARLAELGDSHGPDELPVLAPAGDAQAPFPLTEVQQAFWIGRGSAVDFGNVGCHGYFEWEREQLDPDRFRRAWQRLMERHDMLGAVILPDGTQQVPPGLDGDGITVLDLRGSDLEQAEAEVLRVREEMAHQVLDAHRRPLYDVRLSLMPDGRVRLHMGIDLLIMDAWSWFQVLLPDLIDFYEHPEVEPEPLEVTFRDYVVSSLPALEESERYRVAREYWLSRVPDLPPAPDLPMLAEPEGEVRFERFAHSVDAERWQLLKDRAQRSGITPSGVLTAVFCEVVRAWSANDRFTINFPLFDRLPVHPQIDRLLGDFSNTLMVAVEKTDGTFLERARSIQQQLWRDLEHRHFNGVDVLRQISRFQGASLRPVMPIVVTSLLGHPPRQQASALGRETYGVSQTPQVLLDVQIREIDRALHFKWDHLAAHFPAGMIETMFGAYVALVDRLIDDEAAWGHERFALVPEAQLRRRAEVNATDAEVPDGLLHELLARRAEADPAAPAVITSGRTLSFGELYTAANRIGHGLRTAGTQPGELVAVVMEKGWEQYPAVYGALTAGGGYLPVDPGLPRERLAHILATAGVRTVLTQPRLATRPGWPEGVTVLALDPELSAFPADASPLESVQRPTDPAYTIFTSGSTGIPKGVVVDHRAILNMISDVNTRFDVGPADRAFAVSALHFDISVYDVFGVLAAGGAAVVPGPSEYPDPGHWADLVERTGATLWNSVPALMEMLVDRVEQSAGPDRHALRSLRNVMMGGDFIPLPLPGRLRALAPDVSVLSVGGPTETACFSILYPIDADAIDPRWASIPYGFPMTNQRYHILDDRLAPRPDWVPGRMVVSSEVGLAHGYLGDEEQTRRSFLTLPSGERAYDTGDLGRYRADGAIEILGRRDFQVKINGYRIELGEVEAALERHPTVRSAVVTAPGGGGARRLVAFVVPAADAAAVDTTALRSFAGTWLPPYMVPGDIRVLDRLPLTGNGKTDRRTLARIATEEGPENAVADVSAPDGPLERYVASVYAQVLGLERVETGDDFFHLGGDSLTGTRLAGRLTGAMGTEITLREVFGMPTPASLAAVIAARPGQGESAVLLAEALMELDAVEARTG
ncbi:amino acid adenylation domain-containing protein [Streptomyces sp. bgisy027]|uniref:amino acid adenylation domain-containing protein n=1 Tax=Streptomyces sp. bgisy027 TaxID=3413770 RepID=UPI003D75D9FE